MLRLLKWSAPFVALFALLIATNAAFAQSTLDRARKDGFVRVGFPNQVPYAYADE